MNLKAYLFEEDRGVSPVIGVILMVAITVILAAVIATFVMNMGPDQNTPANANWDWSTDGTGSDVAVTLTHEGGGAAAAEEYKISSDGLSDDYDVIDSSEWSEGDELAAGDEVVMGDGEYLNTGEIDEDDQIQLIWEDPDSDQTQIVDEYEA